MTKPTYKFGQGETLLWLSDARGRYIPRDFAKSFVDRDKHVSGVSADAWEVLEQGPDEPYSHNGGYWDYWDDVLNNATVTDEHGIAYRLHQDGDLWLVPVGMEWSEETETYEWPAHEHD